MALVVEEKKLPVLYKCPYCTSGRFTDADGWDAAVRHIREAHGRKEPKTRRKRREVFPPDQEDSDLLDQLTFR